MISCPSGKWEWEVTCPTALEHCFTGLHVLLKLFWSYHLALVRVQFERGFHSSSYRLNIFILIKFFCYFVYNIFCYGFLRLLRLLRDMEVQYKQHKNVSWQWRQKNMSPSYLFVAKIIGWMLEKPKLITLISQSQFLTTGSELIKRKLVVHVTVGYIEL